jgi:hypothetical protein
VLHGSTDEVQLTEHHPPYSPVSTFLAGNYSAVGGWCCTTTSGWHSVWRADALRLRQMSPRTRDLQEHLEKSRVVEPQAVFAALTDT